MYNTKPTWTSRNILWYSMHAFKNLQEYQSSHHSFNNMKNLVRPGEKQIGANNEFPAAQSRRPAWAVFPRPISSPSSTRLPRFKAKSTCEAIQFKNKARRKWYAWDWDPKKVLKIHDRVMIEFTHSSWKQICVDMSENGHLDAFRVLTVYQMLQWLDRFEE